MEEAPVEFPPLELELELQGSEEAVQVQAGMTRNESHESFDSMESEGSLL
jgi:hypothetical protein